MYKIIYLPTAEEVSLPRDIYLRNSLDNFLTFLQHNDCYRSQSGKLYFLTYEQWLRDLRIDEEIPKYLLEVIDV